MGFHFHFRGLEEKRDLKELIDFLLIQDLGYPKYDLWVQRTEHELDKGYKKVILAFNFRTLVGDLVYQQHKEVPKFLELKNLRVHPDLRDRKFAEFMLKQAEVENKDKYDAIICDLPANYKGILKFMESQGYTSFTTIPLYDKITPDIVLLKLLNKSKESLILSSANKIISNKTV